MIRIANIAHSSLERSLSSTTTEIKKIGEMRRWRLKTAEIMANTMYMTIVEKWGLKLATIPNTPESPKNMPHQIPAPLYSLVENCSTISAITENIANTS